MMINAKLFDQSILYSNKSRVVTKIMDILFNMLSKNLKMSRISSVITESAWYRTLILFSYYLKHHLQNTKNTIKDGTT